MICYRESCRVELRRRRGVEVQQAWQDKMNSDEAFRAEHIKRFQKAVTSSKAKKNARYTVAETARKRKVTVQKQIEAGPHDERNYRRGCKCGVCKADHARVYREYRSTGSFPEIP